MDRLIPVLMRLRGMPRGAIGSPTARYFVPGATIREFLAVLRDFRGLNGAVLLGSSPPLVIWLIAITVS